MRKRKIQFLTVVSAILLLPATTVGAQLIGHYSWGFFYSVMDGKHTISEVDATSSKWVRPVAQNSYTTKRGKYVHLNHGSIAQVRQTSHGNRTYYNFK